ncbi:MAG: bestrophin family ion channel [Lautropia sp.]|nr:bestrophin family ion channel [Lautropia sp.]
MITRSRLHWLRMLFVMRGAILFRISGQLTAVTLFAVIVTILHGQILDWKVSLNFVPFSLIGFTLAIFLGFRNNSSYARYWEGSTLWMQVMNDSRSLIREALTLNTRPETTQALAMRVCAFAHLLRHQLRKTDPAEDLALFLDPGDSARLKAARYKPAIALLMCNEWLGERLRSGDIPPPVIAVFETSLRNLNAALGGCERLATIPIPFAYSVIIHRCVYLYCFWLPFGLLDAIGLMTPVIVCFIAYTFFAIEALGAELEDPFGTESNDLPLGAMSYYIEESVLEMIGEPPRSKKPMVRNFVLQ